MTKEQKLALDTYHATLTTNQLRELREYVETTPTFASKSIVDAVLENLHSINFVLRERLKTGLSQVIPPIDEPIYWDTLRKKIPEPKIVIVEFKIDDFALSWKHIEVFSTSTIKANSNKHQTADALAKNLANAHKKLVRWNFQGEKQGHYVYPDKQA